MHQVSQLVQGAVQSAAQAPPQAAGAIRTLVIHPHTLSRFALKRLCEQAGFEVFVADGSEAWVDLVLARNISLVLCDHAELGDAAIEGFRQLRVAQPVQFVYGVLLSNQPNPKQAAHAMACGVDEVLNPTEAKPALLARLSAMVQQVEPELENWQSMGERQAQLKEFALDLRLLASYQASLLPERQMELGELRASHLWLPKYIVSGDLLNLFRVNDREVVFCLIDVQGHGVQAAMRAMQVARELSPDLHDGLLIERMPNSFEQRTREPHEVLELLNQKYQLSEDNLIFLSVTVGLIDLNVGRLSYATAGSPAPVLQLASGELQAEFATSFPVGIVDTPAYQSTHLHLQPGQRLYFYTNGLQDVSNANGEPLGQDGLNNLLSQTGNGGVVDQVQHLRQGLSAWVAGKNAAMPFENDVALLAFEWTRKPSEAGTPSSVGEDDGAQATASSVDITEPSKPMPSLTQGPLAEQTTEQRRLASRARQGGIHQEVAEDFTRFTELLASKVPASLDLTNGLKRIGVYQAGITVLPDLISCMTAEAGYEVFSVIRAEGNPLVSATRGLFIQDKLQHWLEVEMALMLSLQKEGFQPAMLLRQVNDWLFKAASGGFSVGITLGYIDPITGNGRLATAGLPLSKLATEGQVTQLGVAGAPALGNEVNPQVADMSFGLMPGDRLFLLGGSSAQYAINESSEGRDELLSATAWPSLEGRMLDDVGAEGLALLAYQYQEPIDLLPVTHNSSTFPWPQPSLPEAWVYLAQTPAAVHVELTLHATAAHVNRMVAHVGQALGKQGVDEVTSGQLSLALFEACTNLCRHAGLAEQDTFFVGYLLFEDHVVTYVKDQGSTIPADNIEKALAPLDIDALFNTIEDAPEGGMGLKIMLESPALVAYFQDHGTNWLLSRFDFGA